MSIHTNAAYRMAQSKGAAAGTLRSVEWVRLVDMPKRALIEIALHLAAQGTESYEEALQNGTAFQRVIEEYEALKTNGLI